MFTFLKMKTDRFCGTTLTKNCVYFADRGKHPYKGIPLWLMQKWPPWCSSPVWLDQGPDIVHRSSGRASGPSLHTGHCQCAERWCPAPAGEFPDLSGSLKCPKKKKKKNHLDWNWKLEMSTPWSYFHFTLNCKGFPSICYTIAEY